MFQARRSKHKHTKTWECGAACERLLKDLVNEEFLATSADSRFSSDY